MSATVEIPSNADIAELVSEIWSTLFYEQEGLIEVEPPADLPELVESRVSITGPWQASIRLGLSDAAAELAAHAMLDEPLGSLTPAEVADAVGELINIIGGNIKSSLPEPSAMSLPTVSRQPAQAQPVGDVRQVALHWGEHLVLITITQTAKAS